VDDEPDALEMLRQWLRFSDYVVDTCPDSEQALVVFQERRPDAVLLDLHMPRTDGMQLFSVMHRRDPSVAVIIVTADADEEIARILLSCGAFDYVRKPVDLDYLTTALTAATGGGGLAPASTVRQQSYGALRAVRGLDPASPVRIGLEGFARLAVRDAIADREARAEAALDDLRRVAAEMAAASTPSALDAQIVLAALDRLAAR